MRVASGPAPTPLPRRSRPPPSPRGSPTLISDLINSIGADQLKGFGRLIVGQLVPRAQAAQACGVKAPTLILCDHEFAALVYFLSTAHGAFTMAVTTDGEIKTPEPAAPEQHAQNMISLGYLIFQGVMVCSEGRAMAVMRDQAEAKAAAASN